MVTEMKQDMTQSCEQDLLIELACSRSDKARHTLAQILAVQWQHQHQHQHGSVSIFFHSDAVDVASSEHPHHDPWVQLAKAQQLDMLVCSAALERRQIEAKDGEPFVITTLTQWMDRVASGGRHLMLNRYASS